MKNRRHLLWLAAAPALAALALVISIIGGHDDRRDLADWLEPRVGEDDVVILLISDLSMIDRLSGMVVLYSETVHWNDVVGYRRAWIVGMPDSEVPVLGELTVEDIGPYRVHCIDMSTPRWDIEGHDLIRQLPMASVQRIDTTLHPCPLRAGLFACEGEPWFAVQVRRVMMAGEPFECIYAHPKNDSRLMVVYPTTQGGSGLLLEGGIDDDGVYYPDGTDVQVKVESGNRQLGTLTFTNTPGVQSRKLLFATPLLAPAPLVLEISSQKQDTRHFCFRGLLIK